MVVYLCVVVKVVYLRVVANVVYFCVVPQTSADIQAKKLEEQLSDACSRGDDLQRALTEVNVAKNRLTGSHHRNRPSSTRLVHCTDRHIRSSVISMVTDMYVRSESQSESE